VTSEGNCLHQILFRGFIAKVVNTFARTTFLFLIFVIFGRVFHFTSPIWTILCMSITRNPNKNLFKLQVVMKQNRKNTKGVNTFAKHCMLSMVLANMVTTM
jgi:uncharacterized membrane protein